MRQSIFERTLGQVARSWIRKNSDRRGSEFLRIQLLLAALSLTAPAFAAERVIVRPDASLDQAAASITSAELLDHVKFLASDTLEGREAGTQGGYAAGAYIVEELRKAGLKPLSEDGDWYQYFHPNFRNILAMIPGSDETLRREYVLVGGHYDHVGYGNQYNSRGTIGVIHNGADDNASGSSGVLEVAEALASLKPAPKRSILIAFWDGEEKGLLGSKFYVDSPLVPVEQTKFHINADMIGRLAPGRFELSGWRTAFGMRQFIAGQNTGKLEIDFTRSYRPDSDHYPFFERNVPSLMFHTGKHDDYHKSSDDVDKINVDGIRDISQFLLRLAVAAANADTLPKFRERSKAEVGDAEQLAAVAPGEVRQPSRLGVSYDAELSEERRIVITRVMPDSPADNAGLRPGDEILEFDLEPVSEHEDFRALVLTAGRKIKVLIKRGDEKQTLDVDLRGQPAVFGFQWQRDDAEPDVFSVTRVIPGSPAERSGVKPGQRILKAADKVPKDEEAFRQLLAKTRGPIKLEIEFNGLFDELELNRLQTARRDNATATR